jgi:acetyl-CoA acetyltransferase/uncharacterized OB-fold protein
LPLLTFDSEFFWTGGADGRLRFRRCDDCGALQHPPRPLCGSCRSANLSVIPVAGTGTLLSYTVNHQMWNPEFPPPYVVGLVAIDEDPRVRLTTNVVGCSEDELAMGMRVRVRFEQVGDVWVPLFEPDPDAAAAGAAAPPALPPDGLEAEEIVRRVRPPLGGSGGVGGSGALADKYERRAALSGIGMSDVGRKLMVDPIDLAVRASLRAIEDAGLAVDDIDGISTYPGGAADGGFAEGGVTALEASLRLHPTWHNGAPESGGSNGSIAEAVLAVAAGLCRHVLCVRTVWQSTHGELLKSGRIPMPSGPATGLSTWMAPFGAQPVSTVAMAAARHFRRYGTTRETLGWIALNGRANAALNARAVFQKPLTMDDYLSARMVSTPLSLLDCDPLCDGSVAVVVSAVDAARDLRHPPVRIEALGTQIAEPIEWDQGTTTHEPHVLGPSAHMWTRTDLRPGDVDFAELYDGFSFNCLSWIEALGFCGIGEAKDFLAGGKNIALDGSIPVNTHGGQLSAGRTHGMGLVHEAVVQLRGDGGDRQVAGAEVGVVTTGGLTPGAVMLLTTDR